MKNIRKIEFYDKFVVIHSDGIRVQIHDTQLCTAKYCAKCTGKKNAFLYNSSLLVCNAVCSSSKNRLSWPHYMVSFNIFQCKAQQKNEQKMPLYPSDAAVNLS